MPATTLPPFDKIYLITLWMEAVLWGMNCVVFLGAGWVLFGKRNKPRNQRILGITSLLLFLLVTAHVSLSLRELLEAFVYIPNPAPPLYSTVYWLGETTPIEITKTLLYDLAVWIQDIVLIWRLYIVFDQKWIIFAVPFIIDLVHMSIAFAVTGIASLPTADLYAGRIKNMGTASWSLDLVVNVTVTAAIAGRLWYMGRKVSSTSSYSIASAGKNAYLIPIFTIVESGGLFAAVTFVMLVLYTVGSPLSLSAVNIAVQLAAFTPLLIIVRVGLGLTHGLPTAYKSYLATSGRSMTFANSSEIPGFDTSTTRTDLPREPRASINLTSLAAPQDFMLQDVKTTERFDHSLKSNVTLVGIAHSEV